MVSFLILIRIFLLQTELHTHSFSLCISIIYSNFRSYKSAATSTTRQEPQLCTNAPVVGVSNPKSDNAIATKLMQSDKEILNLIVLTQELDNHFKYGIFAILSLIKAISAASTAISLPIAPIATLTLAVFNAGASFTPSPIIHTVLPIF